MCYPIITPIYEKQVFINPRSSNAFRRLYHQANQCIVIIHILDEPYQRRGNHYVNAEGDSIVFRGLCCSDPIKLYNDSMWNERYFDEMADWGANVVRFAIHPSWLNQIGWERAFELYAQPSPRSSMHVASHSPSGASIHIGHLCSLPIGTMPFSYSDIFLPPLADSIQQWILSKDYGTWDINALIGLEAKVNEVLSPAACDYTQGIGRDIYLKFRDNSVCGPWATWQPNTDTEYFVFHSSTDLYMHYFVSLEMANYLEEHGCKVTTDFSDWGNHIDYGIYVYMLNVLSLIENGIGDGSQAGMAFVQYLQEHFLEFMNPGGDDVTAIESVQELSVGDNEGYYSLSGERMTEEPKRGIYIHQGVKKVRW